MIEKEFQIQVQHLLSPALAIRPDADWNEWMQTVATRVSRLIETDFPALVNLLYQMDVSESKLKALLAGKPGTDTGILIARLMVERQLEKIRTRNAYRSSKDIPDDEKW
ncbi:hypothetical protein [Paraflavitalea pollutisoli]|uniref:hypothetical protein n=1 Tax=Paraflavitalea pollutisoli TaxID=3034143 RepID=UPI0023EB9805|nr:hypothetical protein [Paraflavitalea sp. H1-2-19X]